VLEDSCNITNRLNSWLQGTEEYQAGKTFEYVMQRYGFKREAILRLAGNESTIGTSPLAIKAAEETIRSSNFYDEPRSESLIETLETHFRNRNFKMQDLGIVVGNGMDSIIEHVLKLFTNEQSAIMNFSPSFIYYEFAAKRKGVAIVDVPRSLINTNSLELSYQIDFDKAIKNIKPQVKVIFLCSPNNPDGSGVPLSDIENFAAELYKRGIILFIDHAYIEFADTSFDASRLIEKYPNIIIGYTFSKAYALAGFRVGYALMAKELKSKYLTLITPFLCSRPSLAAAKAALEDTQHLEKIVVNNNLGKLFLDSELKKLACHVYESQANFILFEHKRHPASMVLEKLMSQGIIIRAISGVSNYALRVTIGTEEENRRFINALASILG
jgi:histidinol-phosphate aminotransferase